MPQTRSTFRLNSFTPSSSASVHFPLSISRSLSGALASQAILRPEDIVMGFGPPAGDPEVAGALAEARQRGAMTFELPGYGGSWSFEPPSQNPFIHQELIEILYHTLWETVHVFLEHRAMGYDVGDSGFLYPYLGSSAGKKNDDRPEVIDEVAESIRTKARDDADLRTRLAHEQSDRNPSMPHAPSISECNAAAS